MIHDYSIPGLGPIMQLAYVVEDFDAALASWTDFGVGPFFVVPKVPLVEASYRGKPIDLDLTTAFAYWGDLQIEVIRQNNQAESIFRDWQARKQGGVHHICIEVTDLDEVRRRCAQQDLEILQEKSAGPAGQFIYARTTKGPDLIVEFAVIGSPFRAAFAKMRAAAVDWDGSRPIRPIDEVIALG